MKISIYTSADPAVEVVLAAEGQNGYTGLSLSLSADEQIQHRLRSRFASPIDRGNQLSTYEFAVNVVHASIAEASQYTLERRANVPREGLVLFERKTGEVVNFKRYFQPGLAKLISIVPTGCKTVESWQILGGQLLTQSEIG